MNFVLFHIGENLPSHFPYCVQQIQKTNPTCPVYIITNLNIDINEPNIKIISTNSLNIPDIGNYYKYDPMGPLFRNAMLRIFYIESFMIKYNIEDVIHFDNDVLIYENILEIKEELEKENFYITPATTIDYIFGFSYIKNYQTLSKINIKLYNLIIQGEKNLEKIIGSMPHEMRLLNYVDQEEHNINLLPILPSDKNFNNFKYCFDPSSYGQYLGGRKPEYDKYIGKQIIENNIKIFIENKIPYVFMNNKKYKIFNLHIHNKKMKDFL
jgi:hypothetical protein